MRFACERECVHAGVCAHSPAMHLRGTCAQTRADTPASAQVLRLLEAGAFGAARVDWLVQVLTEKSPVSTCEYP
jgi:hypothetical protein